MSTKLVDAVTGAKSAADKFLSISGAQSSMTEELRTGVRAAELAELVENNTFSNEQNAILGCLQSMSMRASCELVGITDDRLYKWIAASPGFAAAYYAAREVCAEKFANEAVAIPDELAASGKKLTHEAISLAKLQAQTRQWAASVFKPKRFGTKAVELTGKGGGPVDVSIEIVFGK